MPIPLVGALKSRGARVAIAAVLAVEAVIVAAVHYSERAHLEATRNSVEFADLSLPVSDWRMFESPGISRPPTQPAAGADLSDGEEVIGIVVDGRARAYRVGVFDAASRHIVNDLVGDRPITVAYCNITDCARAYAGPPGGHPLDVAQAGLKGGEMIIKVAGTHYRHRSGEPLEAGGAAFPYADYPFERRSWGDWRRAHPETDLYLGSERRAAF